MGSAPLPRVLLAAGYFWLVMLTYYVLKPIRDSLFLGARGFQDLPLAHLMNLAVTFGCIQAYVAASRRATRRTFAVGVSLLLLLGVCLFWVVLGPLGASPAARRVLAWVYFGFVSAFSVFSVTLVWALIHATFTPEEGGRYYGWIGSGGTLGALCGGALTGRFARSLGTENLLLLAVATYLPCLLMGWVLGGRADVAEAARAAPGGPTDPPRPAPEPRPSLRAMLAGNPFLLGIAVLVFVKLAVAVTKDYQIQEIVGAAFVANEDGRTEYFGQVYQWTNMLGLFLGLCVTGPVFARWGPLPGLLTYPVAALATALGLLLSPDLTTVFWLTVVSQACAYSIFQWSQELLYQRTTAEEKFVAKGFIDTFVFRLGTAAASLMILGAVELGRRGVVDARQLVMGSLVVLGVLLLGVAGYLGTAYRHRRR